MVDTPKTDHWQNVVLTPTGVAAGTYNLATIDVAEDGRITNASTGGVPTIGVVSTIAQLTTVTPGTNGGLTVVLDDGFGGEQLYVWNDANVDLGAPLAKWRLIAATSAFVHPFGFRQGTLGTAAIQDISTPIQDVGIIKEVAVEITTAYSVGATINIQDDTGFTYLPFSDINPQLEGIYKIDLSGNLTDVITNGSGQMRAVVGGAPGVGAGVLYVTFVDPS